MYGTFVVTYTIWLRNEMNSLSIILKKVKKKLDSYGPFCVYQGMRNKGNIMKKAKKVKTTEFTGGLRMYKKPQPIVLKGWAVTNDFSY